MEVPLIGNSAEQQQRALHHLRQLRVQIAAAVFPPLLALEYEAAFSGDEDCEEGEEWRGEEEGQQNQVLAGRAAHVAVAAADALMMALGLIQLSPEDKENQADASN